MSKLIVNLTKIAVIQEIEDILETHVAERRQFFSASDLHEALITYVLKRISNCCITLDDCQCSSKNSFLLNALQQEKPHREAIIRQGIEELYQNNHQLSQHILEVVELDSMASEIPS